MAQRKKASSGKKKLRNTSAKVHVKTAVSAQNSKDSKQIQKEVDFENLKDTRDVFVPKGLVEQVIGQDKSVEIIRKAAAQKRNVLLVGLPGTGKSLIAQAMSEILPVGHLQDVLIYPNSEDPNNPKVRVVKAGDGKKILDAAHVEAKQAEDSMRFVSFLLPLGWMLIAAVLWQLKWYSDVIFAALLLIGALLMVAVAVSGQMRSKETILVPKLLVNNLSKKVAPFFEATGARAGALLGDVRHDPLQCHYGFNELYLAKEGTKELELEKKPFASLWDEMTLKYKKEIIKDNQGYEAIMLPDEEKVYTLGYKGSKVVLSRVLSLNRRPFDGNLVELSVGNEKVSVTPEHKVITKKDSKEAEKISNKDYLFKLS